MLHTSDRYTLICIFYNQTEKLLSHLANLFTLPPKTQERKYINKVASTKWGELYTCRISSSGRSVVFTVIAITRQKHIPRSIPWNRAGSVNAATRWPTQIQGRRRWAVTQIDLPELWISEWETHVMVVWDRLSHRMFYSPYPQPALILNVCWIYIFILEN